MKNKNTWLFVLKIVGVTLAVVGAICLVVGYWDRLASFFGSIGEKFKCSCGCSEFDDYDDELMYE